ncbi:MAG: glycosyltransferase [Prosthecobacter sp.]
MNTQQPLSRIAVTILAYRRAEKLEQLRLALRSFPTAELFVFCDGARGESDAEACKETQQVAQRFLEDHPGAKIVVRERNLGLNQNIVQGITAALTEVPFTVVLEEDVIPQPGLFEYLAQAEAAYRTEARVFSIAAFHPIVSDEGPLTTFFSRRFFCWGWATWADRWQSMLPLLKGTTWPYEHYWQIPSCMGTDCQWAHRQHRMGRKVMTWDRLLALWTLKHDLLHLCPSTRLTANIGLDGSGENCTADDPAQRLFKSTNSLDGAVWEFPKNVSPTEAMDAKIREYFTNAPRGHWDEIRKRLNYELARMRGLKKYGL